MSEIKISLTWSEIRTASMVGTARWISSTQQGSIKTGNWKGSTIATLANDIVAACAECAVAKALKIYWGCHVDVGKIPDVGAYYVRHNENGWGHLIIRPADIEGKYIMVKGLPPDMILCGWYPSSEAKLHDEWLKNPDNRGESWFIPQQELFPMETIND